MVNSSKRKGTSWESTVVTALRNLGWLHAERRALHGNTDLGDVAGIPGVVIECKSGVKITLAAWMDELEVEARNAQADVAVLWVKRKGKASAMDGYIMMSPAQWFVMMRKMGY